MARRSDSRTLFDLPTGPDFACEQRTTAALGWSAPIAGVDEAGRGPWAGPVVAAAVVLDPARLPEGLDDSKKLSAAARERLFETITAGHRFAVAMAPVALIDSLNIRGATLWAMAEAVRALAPAHILVDGLDVPPDAGCPGTALVGGDGRSLSIAAASIVAKVTRDRLMLQLDAEFPGYGFAAHKGYGTAVHAAALDALGPCPQHRRSFEPVRLRLAGLAAEVAADLPLCARSGP